MPSALTYPGVYIEEVPSGVRTITGVATSIAAFIGRARKGPEDVAVDITSYADFERKFGGLWQDSAMSFAVRDFFLNGGSHAVVVRLFHGLGAGAVDAVASAAAAGATGKDAKDKAAAALKAINDNPASTAGQKDAAQKANAVIATLGDGDDAAALAAKVQAARDLVATLPSGARTLEAGTLKFRAASQGKWGGLLRLTVSAASGPGAAAAATQLGVTAADLFNLTVTDAAPGGASETYANLTVVKSARRVDLVLADASDLIRWNGVALDGAPPALPDFTAVKGDPVGTAFLALQQALKDNPDPTSAPVKAAKDAYDGAVKTALASVDDGAALTSADFIKPNGQTLKTGLWALEQLFTRDGLFNLLAIPPYNATGDVDDSVIAVATAYCVKRRAMLLLDAPSAWDTVDKAVNGFPDKFATPSSNAALFFPRVNMPNPLRGDLIETYGPSGIIAGIFARTDTQRGVWKSPAGLDAAMVGVSSMAVPMTDEENGLLNPLGVNCLRTFPVFGRVVWGARTLRGADAFGDEYKYIAVRRTALFIEESLYRALKWVVFEPNDEPLWGQIRLNVGAFMHNLFRQGAFQGASARDAYFVRCDATTTTQNDINLGIVNVNVGFAPLKPAEFVVIRLQQIAGQIET